ncbi:glycosyltransferase [Synechococcus sp. RSCCF101]|uniref:glycosyltransferase family 2 protein n=1 Tax=Synechococcus sp. RSCCF101 TaxID=2511069 RepID=UPI00124657A5|nr:glycosyltransferase family 2 protein [Synechococcus sp. RSCCF101]QEY32897.1 glycosyltransferase [Synechococcus sp. RSCCF101]
MALSDPGCPDDQGDHPEKLATDLISIIVPCFNESRNLPHLFQRLKAACALVDDCRWRLLVISDGSTDDTYSEAIRLFALHHAWCEGTALELSRNFGKEAALLAGLDRAFDDACILIDADLQDPPEIIPAMVSMWRQGTQVVNCVRSNRESDTWLKQLTAKIFYRLFRSTSKLSIQLDSSDFRLLDNRAVQAIRSCRESVRFSKGFFAWSGFRQDPLYYKRDHRAHGSGKWAYWKLWNYALDGLFGFSTSALRVWSYIGLLFTVISFTLGLNVTIQTLLSGRDVPGYASVFTAVTFLGGLQLLGIGILGEYVGRIFIEVKQRPHYVISQAFPEAEGFRPSASDRR